MAEIAALPGCLVYAPSRDEALKRVEALALRVLADRLEHDEALPEDVSVSFVDSAQRKPPGVRLPATKADLAPRDRFAGLSSCGRPPAIDLEIERFVVLPVRVAAGPQAAPVRRRIS